MTATTTKERPILFSGPMVRAILDGRKTQTRRVVKPQPTAPCVISPEICWMQGRVTCIWPADYTLEDGTRPDHFAICPYGQPGDRLWVRETAYIAPPNFSEPSDGNCRDYEGRPRVVGWAATMDGESVRCATDYGVKATPSIHMPRWASRITLEITGVRVERVHDISPSDAWAEGFRCECMKPVPACGGNIDAFSDLWEAINGPRGHGWAANPWVWAIEFKRLA